MINLDAGLGPRPATRGPARLPMSRARAAVLRAVESSAGSSTLAQLSERTGLHVNTLRDHLEALAAEGAVRQERAAPAGRGRPPLLYRPRARGASHLAEYAGLAASLAATIHDISDDPTGDAARAGTRWGHELARAHGRPPEPGDVAARRHVVSVFDGMGFDPAVEAANDPGRTTVRLTRCPLLDTARRYPDVVCGVHRGIAVGALQEYGADASEVSLVPFAEPGACLLQLAGASPPPPPR